MNWTQEWPREEGWYWFYGVRNKGYQKKIQAPLKCRRISNGFIYVLDGHFAYESEAGPAWFKKMDEPEDPGFLRELEIDFIGDYHREKTTTVTVDMTGPDPVIHGKPKDLDVKIILEQLSEREEV